MPAGRIAKDEVILSDEIVLDLMKLRNGHEKQWGILTAYLVPRLMAAAGKRLNWHESEDCVQRTLAKLVRKVREGKCDHQIPRFAMHLLKGEVIDQARKRGRLQEREVEVERDPGELPGQDDRMEVGEMVMYAEEHVALRNALKKMESPLREILEERFLAGKKFQDLSVKYQIPIATLSYKIEKGIKVLREHLTHLGR